MKIRLSAGALVAAAAALAGCDDSGPTFVATAPQAYVRYVNGSPDSPQLTARFTDQVENMFTWDRVPFRSHSGLHIPVNAGTRRLRVFLSGNNNLDNVATVVLDTTVELQARTYYTFVQSGTVLPARGQAGNTARVTVFVDTLPEATGAADSTTIRVRAYHVAPAAGNVDVVLRKATATADSAVRHTFPNLAPLERTPYQSVQKVRSEDANALYRVTVLRTGTTGTPIVSARPEAGGQQYEAASIAGPERQPYGGVRVSRSVLSAFVFPAAVAGSPAATATTATPGVILIPDLTPPRLQ